MEELYVRSMWKVLGPASDRKRRLWAVAFCRHIWEYLGDERSRNAVEAAERFADGRASEKELAKARVAAWQVPVNTPEGYDRFCPWNACRPAIREGVMLMSNAPFATAQRSLLRDIFGNPFRPVTFSPDWRTDTVTLLACQIYDSRDFSAMPILADALQDAGCDDSSVLDHCRSDGPHVRGCWVCDLVLEES
jgi:hypothetical protein